MDLLQLQYFISIAKHRNFTAAAREHFISQPNISHQIKSLEKELGVFLFTRSTRSVDLTPSGEIFLEDAKQAVDILEHSQLKLQQNNEDLMKLTIAHLASATKNFLPHVINKFKERHPHIKVQLYRKNADQILGGAQKNSYDIYFSLTPDMMSLSHLAVRTIQTDHYCLVTPNNHPAIQRMDIDYTKLASEPFVFLDPSSAITMTKQIYEICHQLGFEPRIAGTYPLYEDILYAIEAGIGISILPYRTKEYMKNNLAYTLLDSSNISISTSIAWKKDTENPAVALFLDTFREYMQEHPESEGI